MSAIRGRGGALRRRLFIVVGAIAIAASASCAEIVNGRTTVQAVSATGGDIEHGRLLFRKCVSCHSLHENGPNKVGPRLHGLFGRVSGSVIDYKYSRALKNAQIVWDDATLDAYLANTTAMVAGTKMYAYMSREQDRADLIAFLKKEAGGN